MGRNKNKLPDRWLDYSMIGSQISGIPIIPCKLPLDEHFLTNKGLERDQWFTPNKLIEMVPNIGSIIDLTATDKYYNPAVFTTRGIRHIKIGCGGRGTIPNETVVHRFFDVVDAFLRSVPSQGKVLMVHCTHGLNRTGYLVSRYMVERRGFEPKDAIQAFNDARGHKIERQNYLDHLRQMSDRVCRNPVPLFQKSGPRPGHQEQTPTSYDRPTTSKDQGPSSGPRSHHSMSLVNNQLTATSQGRPNSANRSRTDVHHQSASRSQSKSATPVDAGRRKQRSNLITPPPASSSEQRRENRHLRFEDQSVERSTSSTGISHDCRRVDPPGQRDGRRQYLKVQSHSSRSRHRDHPYDRPAESSSSSRQDFTPDRGAPRKKERSRRGQDSGRSAERS